MTIGDVFGLAARALSQHRRRTSLSLLGVAMGATAVIFLTGLGEGARRYVVGEFASLGSNLVIVIPGKTETTGSFPGKSSKASSSLRSTTNLFSKWRTRKWKRSRSW